MPFDAVCEVSTTLGIADWVLTGALDGGCQTFQGAGYVPGAAVDIHYVAEGRNAAGEYNGQREIGVGRLALDGSFQRLSITWSTSGAATKHNFSGADVIVADAITIASASSLIASGITYHVAASDPHGDRAFALALSSGLVSGGVVSINGADASTFDLAAGVAYISGAIVSWDASTGVTVTNIATASATHLAINSDGDIVQSTSIPTASQRRSQLYLGSLGHSDNTVIANVVFTPDVSLAVDAQFRDFLRDVGVLNISGNVLSANGSNLSLDVGAGVFYGSGINFAADTTNPNRVLSSAASPATLRLRTRNAGAGTSTTVDPANYDLAGVVTSMPNNKFQVLRVYRVINGNVVVQYGQVVYDHMSQALSRWSAEAFVERENIRDSAALIGVVAIKKGCTDITNAADAQIIPISFGSGGGSSGTGAPALHASTHQDGGSDEIATTTAAAGAIPKADSTGLIPAGFLVPVTTDGLVAPSGNDWSIPGEWVPTLNSTITVPAGGAIHFVPFTCLVAKQLTEVMCDVSTAGAGVTGQLAVHDASIVDGQYVIGNRIWLDSATFSAASSGLKKSTDNVGLPALARGRSYALAVALDGGCSLRTALSISPGLRNRRDVSSASMFARINRVGATGIFPPPLTPPTITIDVTLTTSPTFSIPLWARWTVG